MFFILCDKHLNSDNYKWVKIMFKKILVWKKSIWPLNPFYPKTPPMVIIYSIHWELVFLLKKIHSPAKHGVLENAEVTTQDIRVQSVQREEPLMIQFPSNEISWPIDHMYEFSYYDAACPKWLLIPDQYAVQY